MNQRRRTIAAICVSALFWASQRGFGQNSPDLVRETIPPRQIIHRPDGVFFLDFGEEAFGYLELEFPANHQINTSIAVRMGEKRTDDQHIDRHPGGSIRFLQTTVTPEPGKTIYRPALPAADARQMPESIGPVMPFRYVELENLPPEITELSLAAAVRQIAVHYRFDATAADFACSDEKLNAIWTLSRNTIKATSFAGLFVDGDRERKPYEADAFINALGWYYTSSDTFLPRLTQNYLITHPTWPTEWIMFSVLSADLDYRYTGDGKYLLSQYDDLKAKTLRALERDDGLISTVQPAVPRAVTQSVHFNGQLKDIVDWPESQRDGCQMLPINTVVNAFHCRALQAMANLATALGKTEDAADFRAAGERTLQSLNARLFDQDTGLYVDGEGSAHSSLHSNMFPLAFGLVPENRRDKVLAFIKSRGMACSPYAAQFLLEGLFNNGAGPDALALMEAPGNRSWRHMTEDLGLTITAEAWDPSDKPNEDWNHAWSAAPANLLPRMILGVEPLEPGYTKTLIWPRGAGKAAAKSLSWARGKVPTINGPVTVEWHQSSAGLQMTIDLPPRTATTVRLPRDWGDAAIADNAPGIPRIKNHTLELEFPTSGKHSITLGKP